MSRRFGRNQRRRLRELVAASQQRAEQLQIAHQMERGLLVQMMASNEDLRHQLRGVAKALGPRFVHLDPLEVGDVAYDLFPPDDFPAYLRVHDGSDSFVPVAITRASAESDNLRHQVHFKVRLNRETAYYAVSLPALYNADEQRLARTMADELAQHLLTAIRQHKGRFQ